MSSKVKILAFSGSSRKGSYNRKLVKAAAEIAQKAGAEVKEIDLRDDFALPLFDEDLEKSEGHSAGVLKLKELMRTYDGFLVACPEYNSSISPLLKNAIDWASRPREDEPPMAAFKNKVIALMSASPGGLGGMRGLVHVRSIFGNIGSLVLPDQLALPVAHEAFNDDGKLKDEKRQKALENLVGRLVEVSGKLKE